MNQYIKKIISVFLFAVFLYGTAPREYLHDLFARHHDTVEKYHKPGDTPEISSQHKHCSFLDIAFGPYVPTAQQLLLFETIEHSSKWVLPVYQYYFFNTHRVLALRGPPVC